MFFSTIFTTLVALFFILPTIHASPIHGDFSLSSRSTHIDPGSLMGRTYVVNGRRDEPANKGVKDISQGLLSRATRFQLVARRITERISRDIGVGMDRRQVKDVDYLSHEGPAQISLSPSPSNAIPVTQESAAPHPLPPARASKHKGHVTKNHRGVTKKSA